MKVQRPLKDRELNLLNNQLNQLRKNLTRQVRILLIWTSVALIIGYFAFFKMKTRDELLLLFATITIYIAIGGWVTGKEFLKQKKRQKSIIFLKNKNLVTAVEICSDLYYELAEQEDEGVYYLFQLPDNKVFSFGGQDFYPTKKFPSDKFEIVEGRGINNEVLLLEVFNYGKKIIPARVITGQDKWNLLGSSIYPDPKKLTIAEGRIEDYL